MWAGVGTSRNNCHFPIWPLSPAAELTNWMSSANRSCRWYEVHYQRCRTCSKPILNNSGWLNSLQGPLPDTVRKDAPLTTLFLSLFLTCANYLSPICRCWQGSAFWPCCLQSYPFGAWCSTLTLPVVGSGLIVKSCKNNLRLSPSAPQLPFHLLSLIAL